MSQKILVVEDADDSRNLLHYLLTSKGYDVCTASDGGEGLYLTKAEKPDLVITDLTMPVMDGVEMIRHIRADPEIAGTKIAVLSAYGAERIQAAMTAGADKGLSKPFDFQAIIQYATECCGRPSGP